MTVTVSGCSTWLCCQFPSGLCGISHKLFYNDIISTKSSYMYHLIIFQVYSKITYLTGIVFLTRYIRKSGLKKISPIWKENSNIIAIYLSDPNKKKKKISRETKAHTSLERQLRSKWTLDSDLPHKGKEVWNIAKLDQGIFAEANGASPFHSNHLLRRSFLGNS